METKKKYSCCQKRAAKYLANSSFNNRTSSSAVHWSDNVVKPQISANRMLKAIDKEEKYTTKQYSEFSNCSKKRNGRRREFGESSLKLITVRGFASTHTIRLCFEQTNISAFIDRKSFKLPYSPDIISFFFSCRLLALWVKAFDFHENKIEAHVKQKSKQTTHLWV